MLIHNKLHTSNTNECRAKRVEKYINQNTRKDTLLKRQQFVTKNQETSVKTELSPDKLYYKSHLSGLKRFLTDKHLTLSNLSVNAYLSPDKLHIPASE